MATMTAITDGSDTEPVLTKDAEKSHDATTRAPLSREAGSSDEDDAYADSDGKTRLNGESALHRILMMKKRKASKSTPGASQSGNGVGDIKLFALHSLPGNCKCSSSSFLASLFTANAAALPRAETVMAMARVGNELRRRRETDQDDGNILYSAYTPYANIKDCALQDMLLQITDMLHYLDRAFAACFPFIAASDPVYVYEQLQDIRRRHTRAQNPGGGGGGGGSDAGARPSSRQDVDLGDLGHFCEQIPLLCASAGPPEVFGSPLYITRATVRDRMYYLQNALELPYWDLMLRRFGTWRANAPGVAGRTISALIHGARLELEAAVAGLRRRARARTRTGDGGGGGGDGGTSEDGLAPVIAGVEKRIRLLGSIRDGHPDGLRALQERLQACTCVPDPPPSAGAPGPGREGSRAEEASSSSTVVSMVAVFVFVALAMAPFSVGFAKASNDGGVGSFRDADFWFLVHGNVMSTLGSVLMMVPLVRGPWLSPAYLSAWLLVAAGLACSVVSLAVYTHVHAGWSSMFGLFGALASVAAVLVMTQAEGERGGRKVKED